MVYSQTKCSLFYQVEILIKPKNRFLKFLFLKLKKHLNIYEIK